MLAIHHNCLRSGCRAARVLTTLAALSLVTGCAHSRTFHLSPTDPGVSVVGTGTASAPPDIARTSLGVEVRAVDVQQATAEAATRMAAVTQAIKAAGIADKDLRTHSFSIGFEAEPQPPGPPLPIERSAGAAGAETAPATPPATPRGFYRVNNALEVTIRDMNAVGRVLSAASAAGANNVWGITFEREDTEPLKAQARVQAIQRAQGAAAELAQLGGVTLGKVLAISEDDRGGRPEAVTMMYRSAANADVPIERGEVTVNYTVRLVYGVEN